MCDQRFIKCNIAVFTGGLRYGAKPLTLSQSSPSSNQKPLAKTSCQEKYHMRALSVE